MPTFGVYTVTGEGSQAFGANENILYINTWVSVLGQAQVLTGGSPRRLMHAGWWALGYAAGVFTASPIAILRWAYLDWESQSFVFSTHGGGPINCDHLYYKLGAGVTAKFFLST